MSALAQITGDEGRAVIPRTDLDNLSFTSASEVQEAVQRVILSRPDLWFEVMHDVNTLDMIIEWGPK